ncbi:MAG: tetratricopeptide repeat protein [Bacteroidia bacterium]|nr:tetratricopeptide repeat protein [Bacteroidia bacterium]
MKFLKKAPLLFVLAALFFIAACQSPTADNKSADETSSSLYSENEIPISTESEDALKQIVDGLHFLDQGNRLRARSYFDKAIELDPECVSAHLYRSYSSVSWKEWSERRDNVLAMRDKANEGEQIIMDMIENGKVGDNDKALELAKSLVAKYPKSARATEILADEYDGLKNREEARTQWAKAIDMDPDFILAIKNLGQSYLFDSPKDFDKAEEYMNMYVEKAPESSRAYIDLGDCYRAQNDLDKALASYTKASVLDPKDPVAHSKAGHANSFLGNYDAARQNFRDSRAVSEHNTGSYEFEAYTYLYEGEHQKAMEFLMASVKDIDAMDIPDGPKTQTKIGLVRDAAMIARHQGNTKEVKSLVGMFKPLSEQMAKDLGSENATRNQKANRQYWDGVVAAMEGDFEGAAALADGIKETMNSSTGPYKLDRHHRLNGMLHYIQEDYTKALEHAVQLDPDDVYDTYWTAKCYAKTGDEDKAMDLYKEIAQYNFNWVGYALVRNEVNETVKGAINF